MLIKESTLRRIIREEAYRSLREEAGAASAAAAIGSGPMTQQELSDIAARVGMPPGTQPFIGTFHNFFPQDQKLNQFFAAIDAVNSSLIRLLASAPNSLKAAQNSKDILTKEGNDGALGKKIASYLTGGAATTLGLLGCLIAGDANTNGPIFAGTNGNITSGIDIIKTKDPNKLTDGGNALTAACQADTSLMQSVRTITSMSYRKILTDIDQNSLNKKAADGAALTAANTTPYTVVAGDTIAKIAQARYGIVPSRASMSFYEQLAATIKNRQGATANMIKVGDIINLPASLGGKALIAAAK